jgi:hypothetical protein
VAEREEEGEETPGIVGGEEGGGERHMSARHAGAGMEVGGAADAGRVLEGGAG